MIVLSGGERQAIILAGGATALALIAGFSWEQIKKFNTVVTLVDLSLSAALTNGTPSSGTLVGAQPGSSFVLGGSPPTGFAIASSGGTYTFTGAGTGTGTFTITETNASASGSPHTTTIHYSIGVSGGGAINGQLDFSTTSQSGLLALLEDV